MKRPVPIHDIIRTKVTVGIFHRTKHVIKFCILKKISDPILNDHIFAVSEKNKSQTKKETEKTKEEPSSLFQRQRVDMLLGELLNKFPLPMPPQFQTQQAQNSASQQQLSTAATVQNGSSTANAIESSVKPEPELQTSDIKQEPLDNPSSNGPNSAGPVDNNSMDISTENIKVEPKTEMKPPPEKKMKV